MIENIKFKLERKYILSYNFLNKDLKYFLIGV